MIININIKNKKKIKNSLKTLHYYIEQFMTVRKLVNRTTKYVFNCD